jgi:hypothetical protein
MSHLPIQIKLDSFCKLALLHVQKQVQLLSFLTMNKCAVFLQFLNKGFTAIYFYLFSSAVLISLNFPFICVLFFCLLRLPFVSVIRIIAYPDNPTNYPELARVYCNFKAFTSPTNTCLIRVLCQKRYIRRINR